VMDEERQHDAYSRFTLVSFSTLYSIIITHATTSIARSTILMLSVLLSTQVIVHVIIIALECQKASQPDRCHDKRTKDGKVDGITLLHALNHTFTLHKFLQHYHDESHLQEHKYRTRQTTFKV